MHQYLNLLNRTVRYGLFICFAVQSRTVPNALLYWFAVPYRTVQIDSSAVPYRTVPHRTVYALHIDTTTGVRGGTIDAKLILSSCAVPYPPPGTREA